MKSAVLLVLAGFVAASEPEPPARVDYQAVEADFLLFEKGLKGMEKVAPRLFPKGLDRVDALLFDTEAIYIYTRHGGYPFPLVRRKGGWKVYRAPHRRRPTHRELAKCSGGLGSVTETLWTVLPRRWFACSAWGAFGRIQAERRSAYQYEEGYLATVVHEAGHLYMRNRFDSDEVMLDLESRIKAMPLEPGVDSQKAHGEAYAAWAEAMAARELYAPHWRRMKDASAKERGDDEWGHVAGLRAAVAYIEETTKR